MNEIVLIYDIKGTFRGYTILNANKLASTNLWPDAELKDLQMQIDRLNEGTNIKQFWPNTRDPEVQALLNDPNFMPYETTTEQAVDEENSYYVWDRVTQDGQPAPGASIDHNASVIAYKAIQVPVRPEEVTIRFKRAHEIVARRRAGLDEGENLIEDHGVYRSVDDEAGEGYTLDHHGRGPTG